MKRAIRRGMLLGILLTLCACFFIIKGVELYGEDIFQYVDLTPPEAKTGNAEGGGKEISYFKRHPDYYVERLYVVDKEGSLLWSRLVPFCRYLYRFLDEERLLLICFQSAANSILLFKSNDGTLLWEFSEEILSNIAKIAISKDNRYFLIWGCRLADAQKCPHWSVSPSSYGVYLIDHKGNILWKKFTVDEVVGLWISSNGEKFKIAEKGKGISIYKIIKEREVK